MSELFGEQEKHEDLLGGKVLQIVPALRLLQMFHQK